MEERIRKLEDMALTNAASVLAMELVLRALVLDSTNPAGLKNRLLALENELSVRIADLGFDEGSRSEDSHLQMRAVQERLIYWRALIGQ